MARVGSGRFRLGVQRLAVMLVISLSRVHSTERAFELAELVNATDAIAAANPGWSVARTVTALRKMVYDDKLWDYMIAEAKPTPPLAASDGVSTAVYTALKGAASTAGAMANELGPVDLAHVWAGMDASLHPKPDQLVVAGCAAVGCSLSDNTAVTTWAGDAGSAVIGCVPTCVHSCSCE